MLTLQFEYCKPILACDSLTTKLTIFKRRYLIMKKDQKDPMLVLKMVFGVFMVCVYLGMAALMAINFFHLPNALCWVFAIGFAAYGLYRGYRELKGEHTYGMHGRDDDESQSMSYVERLKHLENINQDNDCNKNEKK